MNIENQLLATLESARQFGACLDLELQRQKENFRTAGRNPDNQTHFLKMNILGMVQTQINTVEPRPNAVTRALFDHILTAWMKGTNLVNEADIRAIARLEAKEGVK